jgi:hypothetical protein
MSSISLPRGGVIGMRTLVTALELALYGLDIDPEKPLVWVKGELDKLTAVTTRPRLAGDKLGDSA